MSDDILTRIDGGFLLRVQLAPHLSVGWYGYIEPSHRRRWTMVHVHRKGEGPICGARVRGESQWCAHSELSYVECDRCKAMLRRARASLVEGDRCAA